MKRYKHIPTNLVYGFTEIRIGNKEYLQSTQDNMMLPKFFLTFDSKDWVEEESDKEYKILSFKQNSNISDLWTSFPKGWCRNDGKRPVTAPYTYDEILNDELYTIYIQWRD